MPLFLIFVFSVFISVAGAFYFGIRYGKRALKFHVSLLIFAYIVVCYFAGFLSLCISPYWIDNGSEKFISFGDRWLWATLVFYLFAVIFCPLLFLGYKIINSRHIKERNAKNNHS